MCIVLKYGIWNVLKPQTGSVNALVGAGYSPLSAMILSARGMNDVKEAGDYLRCNKPLDDPLLMKDMDLAASRVALAMTRGEKIAVFGDYDVDGITSTCLLTAFLRSYGADVVSYIPGRLEEGYGLNPIAIRQLSAEGVQLIITVDCGITAVAEAQLCKELGIDLVITDHHECKDILPEAVAVVDPHRPDCGYPHMTLCGVGVAFKLASALCGSQEEVLRNYADMVCLGTVADVMPLQGENRVFVARGLEIMKNNPRPGIAALMKEAGCTQENVTASSIGFMLAPRINAAGRMGQIDLAVELFLTDDPQRAELLAQQLCDLNRQRQAVESEIYSQAVSMLPQGKIPEAIVLADETWHQGVVGIVSNRLAEEYCCPVFLICLDGESGKASSRSFGGFNLFAALTASADLLESYGGHELAAGFTIRRDMISAFREKVCQLASEYYAGEVARTQIEIDCAITPELLSVRSIDSLNCLEPCGSGCPKPVLMMERLIIDRINLVGNGRHMRLRFKQGNQYINGIYFSATPQTASIEPGDIVDVAFNAQINEYRDERTVQMNVLDIRPSCAAPCSAESAGYAQLCAGKLTAETANRLLPDRNLLATVWKYLANAGSTLEEYPMCLCRKIVRWSGQALSLEQLLTCLDIFHEVGLLQLHKQHKNIAITLTHGSEKADLNTSCTMQKLLQAKES